MLIAKTSLLKKAMLFPEEPSSLMLAAPRPHLQCLGFSCEKMDLRLRPLV